MNLPLGQVCFNRGAHYAYRLYRSAQLRLSAIQGSAPIFKLPRFIHIDASSIGGASIFQIVRHWCAPSCGSRNDHRFAAGAHAWKPFHQLEDAR